jgi:hypothetical protein
LLSKERADTTILVFAITCFSQGEIRRRVTLS